jgi:hypothetical protein
MFPGPFVTSSEMAVLFKLAHFILTTGIKEVLPVMVAQAGNTQGKAHEAGGSQVQDQPQLH